ncbi:MAG: TerC family protein [bacterium]|nr:TerC family protein [bacterium]
MIVWILFLALIVALLALDLGVFHRRAHVIAVPEALRWSALWIGLGLAFGIVVYFLYDRHWLGVGVKVGDPLTGSQAALQYLTGYVVEKSLSLDNIFVIAMIFRYFRLPAVLQHRALYWGILGAMVLRGAMIAAGVALIRNFAWVTFVFGAILLWTALRFLRHDDTEPHLERNPVLRLARRFMPITADYHGQSFVIREGGRLLATPLVPLLLVVETSDVVFAVDSIPAVFAVTRDPFIVFTSNIFAILGLRALYFALIGFLDRLRYLKPSLALVLGFVGAKMLAAEWVHVPALWSLAVIAGILTVGAVASLLSREATTAPSGTAPGDDAAKGPE